MSTDYPHRSHDCPAGAFQLGCGRREFLKVAAAIPAVVAAAGVCGTDASAGEANTAEAAKMPQISLGKHSISRLIVGCHDIDAGTHLGPIHNCEAREYYTLQQAVKTLRHCEEVGINAWQSHQCGKLLEIFQGVRKAGGKMVMVGLTGYQEEIKPMAKIDGLIAVAHHGELTDLLFKTGKLDLIHDCLKRIRDAGLAVGVSTHMPAVVDSIESKGWDVDYYQTCVYERHRSAEELKKYLGHVPVSPGEVYLRDDPPRMFKVIQQTKRTCLAFKILAGGRRYDVEQAFRETFAAIKPIDAVIVGIYDRFSDQAGQNAALASRFGSRA
jgi:hypothetical protein